MFATPLVRRLPGGVFLRGCVYAPTEASTWRGWLSDEEQTCLDEFGAESRRCDFLAGRAAARIVLANRLETTPDQVPLRRADDEAVDVRGTDWYVSIAHSNGRGLAGAAQQPVGVDLEYIQPRDPEIVHFLLRPDEQDLPGTLPYERNRALLLCWTLKEATLKARRSGFRMSPTDLRLSVQPEEGTATVQVEGGTRWHLVFAAMSGFWGAVAVGDE